MDSKGHGGRVSVSAEELNRMAIPLTVVRGYVQLLQRRIRSGRFVNNDELLRTLTLMEEATRTIQAELRTLDETASLQRLIRDADESDGSDSR